MITPAQLADAAARFTRRRIGDRSFTNVAREDLVEPRWSALLLGTWQRTSYDAWRHMAAAQRLPVPAIDDSDGLRTFMEAVDGAQALLRERAAAEAAKAGAAA